MKALDRKLLRDLVHLKGQMITISLVVAAGIASYVALRGAYASLENARAVYYERARFADVFAHLERAPESVATDLSRIPGVTRVETRVVELAMMPLPQVAEPIRAQVVSQPRALNLIQVTDGRALDPARIDEVLLLKSFADAQRIAPGARVPVVVNGKQRLLRVVGIVRSPEYVFAISPGEISPDPERFAVLFMNRDALAATFRMEGAFNDVSLDLKPDASERAVVDAVDRVLQPYGGVGALPRSKQPSNFILEGELLQLRGMATVLPIIFLLVASLLVNVVLSRLVHLQRPEIATMKAVGYSDFEVGAHFFKLVIAIGAVGVVMGLGLGVYLGDAMIDLYERYFKFPELHFRLDAGGALAAALLSLVSALMGAFSAVWRVMRLPPAEAMRPPAPTRYRRSIIDRLGLTRAAGPSLHMIVRELERRPLRTLFSTVAIAASVGLVVIGGWYYDGVQALVYTQFHEAMREDVTVAFIKARPARAVRELAHLPGVLRAEGVRAVAVRFHVGHIHRDGVLMGYAADAELRRLRDALARPVALPPDGVVLTDLLAERLGVRVGDRVEVEIREGQRETRSLLVSGLVAEAMGLQGHMDLDALQAWLGEEDHRSMAFLKVDPAFAATVDARLKTMPFVASVNKRSHILERFRDQSAGMIVVMSVIITLLASTITVGVVYNNARVALSMRARDLASLRVLGFSRGEVSAILLGEMAIPVVLAIVPGLWMGRGLVELLASTVDPETWRMPIFISARAYAFAALVALVASALSAMLVRRRLDRLDLVAVLKTRE